MCDHLCISVPVGTRYTSLRHLFDTIFLIRLISNRADYPRQCIELQEKEEDRKKNIKEAE